ncbi:class I SAM-dependent methyltransferase [Kineococcus sp. SYSU DK001]|uniref:class I SAM-dependent methyltransferase n=1 Tax=Kineococcus sp. SYSU DK001 TaxID=3383122 RepID=UPI003D7E12E0
MISNLSDGVVGTTERPRPDVSFVVGCAGTPELVLRSLQDVVRWSDEHEPLELELVLVSAEADLLAAAQELVSGAPVRALHVEGASPRELLGIGSTVASGQQVVTLMAGELIYEQEPEPGPSAPEGTRAALAAAEGPLAERFGSRHDPHRQGRAAREQPLLLHSLSLFREVFELVFAHRTIRTVVEVGVESGQVSGIYAELGAERVHCVEPAPSDELRRTLAANPALELVERPSPTALADLPVADLYILDGDHNYATVRAEVEWITRNAPDAVVVLHDVLWPCSRRDFYYQPSHVPADQQFPSSEAGATVWHDELDETGFRGEGAFRFALHAGGERNGVLTAVEDAVAGADAGWTLSIVPAVFGVGILARDGAETRALTQALSPYTTSELLYSLENNRIALFTRVLHLDAAMVTARQVVERQEQALQDLTRRVGELESDLRSSRAQLDREQERVRAVRAALEGP